MKPKRIFIIRHGESHGNVNNKIYETVPDWKIELTDKGLEHSRSAGRLLFDTYKVSSNAAVYVSPFKRTIQTWEGIKSQSTSDNFNVKQDPRLREQEWGHLRLAEETHEIDKERQEYGTFFYRLPDGESGADVYDRATGFLDTLYRDFLKPGFPEDVVIVTHGYTLRVLLMRWFHWTVEGFHKLKNPPNCFIAEMRLNKNDKFELITQMEIDINR